MGEPEKRSGRGKPATGRAVPPGILGKPGASQGPAPGKGSPTARGAAQGTKPKAGGKASSGVAPIPAPAWLRQHAKGIDITPSSFSKEDKKFHAVSINWKKVAEAQEFRFSKGMDLPEPISFAFLQASVGLGIMPFFKDRWSELKAESRRIMRGAYHFFRFGENNDPAGQAAKYLSAVGSLNGALPPALDIEDGAGGGERREVVLKFLGISPATGAIVDEKRHAEKSAKCVADMKIWLDIVFAETKRKAIIYTFTSYWTNELGNPKAFSDHPLWIANYFRNIPASEPESPHKGIGGWSTWTFWQIAGESKDLNFGQSVHGIGRMVDMNLYNGSVLNLWLKHINDPASPLPPGVLK